MTEAEATYRASLVTLLRLAWLITGSRADAEDAVHDAWIRCAPRLASVADPSAYLRRAVANACVSQHRRRAAGERAVARLNPREPEVASHLVELHDALAGLNARQRAAVVLRYYGGFDDEAIAEALGCRRGTVRVLVHRGVTHLREVLEP